MHPLRAWMRSVAEVDADPRAAYFRQVANGVFVAHGAAQAAARARCLILREGA